MSLDFTEDEGRRMRELQAELTRVLLRANENRLEAALAVFALARCMRPLIDLYPAAARLPLRDLVVAFLEHGEPEKANKLLVM
jgi:hypothetical protein